MKLTMLLNAAIGPIRGRHIDWQPSWLGWVIAIPAVIGIGMALAYFGFPLLHKLTERELLETIFVLTLIGAMRR